MLHRRPGILLLLLLALAPGLARGDEPLTERFNFRRASDFFATGATLATDTDNDGEVDTLLTEASLFVEEADLAPNAFVQQALIYWGGTIAENSNCAGPDSSIDSNVTVTVPGASATAVQADVCYCAGGDNQSRDMQSCRADVTALVQGAGGGMVGPWSLGGFQAQINDGDTDNASFAVVLVFGAPGLPPRQLTIYDGLRTMRYDTISLTLDDLDVDDPPAGDLTWYVLEGDLGGSEDEEVTVRGLPDGRDLLLGDDVNPLAGPMNRTINTTYPPQTDVVGVDIDTFDISEALAPGDDAVQVTYTADSDKWWIAFNIVGVRLFFSEFSQSSLTWVLSEDRDGDGAPSPGDQIRYGAEIINSGEGNATISLTAPIPPQAASWSVLGFDGGSDQSIADELRIAGLPVPAGQSARVDFAIELAEVPAETAIAMQASYVVSGGGGGVLNAPDVVVGEGNGGSGPGLGDDDDGFDSGWTQGCACSTGEDGSPALLLLLLPFAAVRRRASRTTN